MLARRLLDKRYRRIWNLRKNWKASMSETSGRRVVNGMRRKSKCIEDLYTSAAREAPQKKNWVTDLFDEPPATNLSNQDTPRPDLFRRFITSTTQCVRLKIISMGALGVGKSCLIKRFCEERFVSKYISTIGIDYGVKLVTVNGESVRINFWDLSGHPDFFEIRNEFYKDSQGAMLVYDVANRATFDELDQWLAEAASFGASGIPMAVCANKIDKRRVVSEEEGRRWAKDHGFKYFETSASSGASVGTVFMTLFETVLVRTKAK